MLRSRAPALFFLTPALAAAAPFPPGLEHDLLALLAGDLPGGCARAGVSIQSFAVDVKVACGLDTGTLRLLDRDDADASGEIRRTLSFSILAQGDVPAVRNAERALADRIAARDDGTVHRKVSEKAQPTAQVHTSAPPDSWSSARKLGPLDDARRAASWLALIGLLVWLTASVFSAHPERRPEAPESKGALIKAILVLCGAAFMLGLAMRWKYGAWAPLHANSHGIAELRGLASTPADWQGPVETDRYGVAYRQVVRSVIGLWHGRATSALAFGAIAGALSVVPVVVLTFLLTDSIPAASIAAIGLALHPIHILLSPSEGPMPLAGLLFLIGTASWCATARLDSPRQRAAAYWAGALALACCAELAVTTHAFPIAAVVVAVGALRSRLWADRRLWIGPLLLLAASDALHLYALGPVLGNAIDERSGDLRQALLTFGGVRNALLDPTLASRALLPMAALGIVVLLIRRKCEGLALAIASALIMGAAAIVNGCRTDAVRYQGTAHLLLFVLAGCALVVLPGRWQWAGAVAGAIVFIPHSNPRVPLLDVEAYSRIRRATVDVRSAFVQIAPRRMAGGLVLNDFPEYALQERGIQVEVSEAPPADQRGACFVWIGPACSSFARDEAGSDLRPECAAWGDLIPAGGDSEFTASHEAEFHRLPPRVQMGLFRCR